MEECNAVCRELAAPDPGTPPYRLRGLEREELSLMGSVALHELCDRVRHTFFRNMNGDAVLKRIAAVRNDQPLPNEDPSSTKDVPSRSVEELATQVANGYGVQIVDARQRNHMSRHVNLMARATRRDPDRVDEWIAELRPDTPVAVYCSLASTLGVA